MEISNKCGIDADFFKTIKANLQKQKHDFEGIG
jgi:hypothetical protein